MRPIDVSPPQVLDIPEISIARDEEIAEALPWRVVIYNDEVHTFEEVIFQIQKATGTSLEAAFEITMNVHTKGSAICYEGTLERCERVAAVLREISLKVDIIPSS